VEQHGGTNWGVIASSLLGRSSTQCYDRWHGALAPAVKHGPWTPKVRRGPRLPTTRWLAQPQCAPVHSRTHGQRLQEDEDLRAAVSASGINAWEKVAALVGRTKKQCRQRWFYRIRPSIRRGKWTTSVRQCAVADAQAPAGLAPLALETCRLGVTTCAAGGRGVAQRRRGVGHGAVDARRRARPPAHQRAVPESVLRGAGQPGQARGVDAGGESWSMSTAGIVITGSYSLTSAHLLPSLHTRIAGVPAATEGGGGAGDRGLGGDRGPHTGQAQQAVSAHVSGG